jgi:hypothetical protein
VGLDLLGLLVGLLDLYIDLLDLLDLLVELHNYGTEYRDVKSGVRIELKRFRGKYAHTISD